VARSKSTTTSAVWLFCKGPAGSTEHRGCTQHGE
jgi:hypothetical protein